MIYVWSFAGGLWIWVSMYDELMAPLEFLNYDWWCFVCRLGARYMIIARCFFDLMIQIALKLYWPPVVVRFCILISLMCFNHYSLYAPHDNLYTPRPGSIFSRSNIDVINFLQMLHIPAIPGELPKASRVIAKTSTNPKAHAHSRGNTTAITEALGTTLYHGVQPQG